MQPYGNPAQGRVRFLAGWSTRRISLFAIVRELNVYFLYYDHLFLRKALTGCLYGICGDVLVLNPQHSGGILPRGSQPPKVRQSH